MTLFTTFLVGACSVDLERRKKQRETVFHTSIYRHGFSELEPFAATRVVITHRSRRDERHVYHVIVVRAEHDEISGLVCEDSNGYRDNRSEELPHESWDGEPPLSRDLPYSVRVEGLRDSPLMVNTYDGRELTWTMPPAKPCIVMDRQKYHGKSRSDNGFP
jgi:hypothetical protein